MFLSLQKKYMKNFSNHSFKGEKVLIRVDFNVPLDKTSFHILDDTRITAALPTIRKIIHDGGSVILMSHLGRPKGGYEEKYSLKHLVDPISKLLSLPVAFAEDCIGEIAMQKANALQNGQVLLLENLRFHGEEEKGDPAFAKQLAQLAPIWVNDAFGTAHRAHASTAVIAQFIAPDHRFFGLLMEAEVKSAEQVLQHTIQPFTAIIGGSKVSDKILILENLLQRAQHIIIGGGMAYTFIKAQQGRIGKSICEEDKLSLALEILNKAKQKGVSIHLPIDSVVAGAFSNEVPTHIVLSNNIAENDMGLDIGIKAQQQFTEVILASKTLLWNGPMGVFEMSHFQAGTKAIATAIAQATAKGAFSLVGGGDSVSAVNQFGFHNKVSYVSTGGGAMLEYFEGKILPGIAAVKG